MFVLNEKNRMSSGDRLPGGNFFKYLDELLGRLRKTILLFVVLFFALFLTGPITFKVEGVTLYALFPSFYHSFSIVLFRLIESDILPKGLQLLNISPFDAVVSDIYISIAVSASVVVPILVYQIVKFSGPALYEKERRTVNMSIIPIFVLFVIGAVFALALIIPLLLRVIYLFTINLQILPTIGVKDFITIILLIIVGMGLIFETPIIVFSLSYLRIVPPSTWFKNWRYAVIGAFFIALLISPGATGGIMEITIALIILALYFSGALLAKKFYPERD